MTLMSVDDLAAQHDDADLAICDVRFFLDDLDRGRREYDEGHIPGAVFVDLHHDLAGRSGGGRHPLPAVDDFIALLERLGIGPGTLVVAYDAAGGATASRLWWMLRSIGHSRAAVLDGGFQAWVDGGHPVTAEVPSPFATHYPPAPGWTGIVDADDVAQGVALGATLIDARAPERFRGESEPIDARAGHIPGAVNRFHGDTLGTDGLHRPLPDLVELFSGVGASPIVYCGSGVTACHDLLALSLVGITGARLYPGSWSEWSSDSERPIATGES